MTEKFMIWFDKVGNMSPSDAFRSILLLILVVSVRTLVLRLIRRSSNLTLETKQQWALTLRNLAFIIILVGLIMIWTNEIRSLALSLAAVAVAVTIGFKEWITCLLGAFLCAVSNSYRLGEHVELGPYKGRVVGVNLLTTTLLETGPSTLFQYTGRAIVFPNSMLFTGPVIRLDYSGDYVAHAIEIPVPFALPIHPAREALMAIAEEIAELHIESARKYLSRMEARHLTDIPSVEPRFAIAPVDENCIKLVLRMVIPQAERHEIEQEIRFRFMEQIPRIIRLGDASLDAYQELDALNPPVSDSTPAP